MVPETNPYQAPTAARTAEPPEELRRPPIGTFLLVLWGLEGAAKFLFVAIISIRGGSLYAMLLEEYRLSSPASFFFLASFLVIETIGPWVGVYYLTGRRARSIPFDAALFRTLAIAATLTLMAVTILMVCLQQVA